MNNESLEFELFDLEPIELQGNGLGGNGISGNGISCPIEEINFDLYLNELSF